MIAGRLLTLERYLMGQRGEIFHPRVRGSARNEQRWFTCGLTGSLGIPGDTLAGVNGRSCSDQGRAGLICTLKHLLLQPMSEVGGEQSDKHLWFSQAV